MENRQVDELYCFCNESNDKTQWELWNSVWMGQGMKKVLSIPKEQVHCTTSGNPDIMMLVLMYLNMNPNELGLANRLQVEVKPARPLPTILRVKWYEQQWCSLMVHRFLTQKSGKWVEVPEPGNFVPIWGEVKSHNQSFIKKTKSEPKPKVKEILIEQDIVGKNHNFDTEATIQEEDKREEELLKINEPFQVGEGDYQDPNQMFLF